MKRETSAGKQPEQRGRREKSKFISLLQRREGSVEELETPATCLSVHLSVSPVCLYTCLPVHLSVCLTLLFLDVKVQHVSVNQES